MTAPRDEEEVVVSLRLQPVVARPEGWRGRSSSLIAVGLVGFIVIGVVLGAAFDDGVPTGPAAVVPSAPTVATSPTPRPNPTLRPRLPPLPALEVVGGTIPTERRLVSANGLQVLDLATGELISPPRPYEDLLLARGTDELVCACMDRRLPVGDATTPTVTLRFERLDTEGTILVERDVITFEGVAEVSDMSTGFTVVAALSPDERSLFVLTAVRRPPVWTIELHQLDVISGELIGTTLLDEIPVDLDQPETSSSSTAPDTSPSAAGPPQGVFVWGNWLATSPGGGVMEAAISYSEVRGETWTNGSREWLVPLTKGKPGAAAPIRTDAQIGPNGWCAGPPEFVDDELLVQVCTLAESPDFRVRRVTVAGESLEDFDLPEASSNNQWYPLATALDRSRRAVLSWDPVRHSLARVSVDDGAVEMREVAPSMLPESNSSNRRGFFGATPGLVLSPDGQRLYALGFGPGPGDSGTPTGVWVFDAESLNLVDRWMPRAMLTSLAVSADGRFVYAAGAQGFDVQGYQNQWPSSITVYDAATGEIQVIHGQVTTDAWIAFQPLS